MQLILIEFHQEEDSNERVESDKNGQEEQVLPPTAQNLNNRIVNNLNNQNLNNRTVNNLNNQNLNNQKSAEPE